MGGGQRHPRRPLAGDRGLRLTAVLNADARALAQGDSSRVEARVAEAFASAGLSVSIQVCEGRQVGDAVRRALACGVHALAVGGGDGTISAAADALSGSGVPLAVLALGTLNHFARDLGIPLDPHEAARMVARGRTGAVDLGEVNGRVFLNNSSIGVYPELVQGRESLRARRGVARWPATAWAALGVLRRFPLLTVTLGTGGQPGVRLRTPFVFVGNNSYELRLLELGRRRSLAAGMLSVYLARRETRLGLVRLGLRAIAGRLDQDRDFRTLATTSLEIRSRRPRLEVAVDGELAPLEPPIRYRVRPAALRVFLPVAS